MNNQTIHLPETIVQKYSLPSNKVKSEDIQKLVDFQKDRELKFSPKLQQYNLTPNFLQKMRVSTSSRLFSPDTTAGLSFLSSYKNDPSMQTTAWLLGLVDSWFKCMSVRSSVSAWRVFNLLEHKSNIAEFLEVIEAIKIGDMGVWKPVQTGIILSTQSAVGLTEYLLNERDFQFVLTSRFSQDCLENLFSLVRHRQSKPSALLFKQNLRMITVSQFNKKN